MDVIKHANTGNQYATKAEDQKATSKLICRVNPKVKAGWVKQAQKENKKLTAWVIDTLNKNCEKT